MWEGWRKRRAGNNVNIVHIYIYKTLKDEFNFKKIELAKTGQRMKIGQWKT